MELGVLPKYTVLVWEALSMTTPDPNLTHIPTSLPHGPEDITSLPLYRAADVMYRVVTPVIIVAGAFGHVMTLVVMRKVTSSSHDSTVNVYLVSMAVADMVFLLLTPLPRWVQKQFGFWIYSTHTVSCKVRAKSL
jgi:hypothetical protein